MELTPELLQQSLKEAVAEGIKSYRESEPAIKTAEANLQVVRDEADQPWRCDGEFFQAVKTAVITPTRGDPRLYAKAAAGNNEAIPSQGGFLVPPQIAGGILEKVFGTGSLLSRMNVDPVVGNRMVYNVVDESSRADGSRFGGVTGYWLAEAASKTVSKPTFRQLDIVLNKVAALCVATDELLEDAGALQSWLTRTVPDELRFMVEDAIINGTGAGQPYGILSTSDALLSATRVNANAVTAVCLGNMWAARYAGANDYIWLVNQSVFPQLMNMTIGQMPMFMPAGGLSGLPYAQIFGRPVIETEYNPTLGTLGDVILFAPSQYACISKGGVKVDQSIHVYFDTDQTAFRFVYRFGGSPIWRTVLTGNDGASYSPYVVLAATT